LREAAEVLVPVADSLLADDYANYIADRLLADYTTVRHAISAAKHAHRRDGASNESTASETSANVDTPQLRAERELLAVLVSTPRLRLKAQELLAMGLLSTADHQEAARVIAAADEAVAASELQGLIEQRVPGSAKDLSSARLGESATDMEALAEGLVRRLKEFDLERRIAVGKAWLRTPGSFKDADEYDDTFREVSSLQRALDALRRGEEA
jgi:DNA primase